MHALTNAVPRHQVRTVATRCDEDRETALQISPTQQVPWHYHHHSQDTFYVHEGQLRLFLRDPQEEVQLGPGQTYVVKPGRPHLVTNGGTTSATFFILQGMGEYDYVPVT